MVSGRRRLSQQRWVDLPYAPLGPVSSGSRRDATCGEGISHYQLEITYSRFEKMIRFPRSIEQASIDQDYRDGLLILQLREVTEQARAARG